ncbi:hypothetical protein PFICI_11959 [Pestalotiopsis fici W106-1]|uniref:Cyanovirin-N domain-containing protein n=1 Tax=Pestalotiopsis fici (strain W106-1 / CGMCC3.15140) TaxID=1229662 RepID=W3WTS0_PESFW|nr:uncharacterized protein PFICI_11959 [Pestalotiopsis fici W106-1]ETS76572.1 hypothetical protein PFICI_11959 [Pestalotiopsis fici W106-1]
MQFHNLLILALSATSTALPSGSGTNEVHSVEKRGCYSGGEPWGDSKDYAFQLAAGACNSAMGQRTYTALSSSTSTCYDLGNNRHVNFNIFKLTGDDRFLGYDECYDGLQKEINGCGYGGDSSYTNWRYISDPNAGGC